MKQPPHLRNREFRFHLVAVFLLAIGVAVALACIVATVTFPLFADISGRTVMAAVTATAFLVAFPIVLMLTYLLAHVAGQKRDLAAREELFVTAQQIGKFGYWHYDVGSSEFTLSENVSELLGDYSRELKLSLPKLLDMTHLEDREKLADALGRIVMEGTCEEIEYRLTGLDGVEKTFWVDGRRMLDERGTPIRAYGACRDVSEQKKIEAALRESEDHYRYAVELNAQIPWTADPAGNIEELGPRWSLYTGVEQEEALGIGWVKALHPDDLASTLGSWTKALRSGHPVDVEYRLRQRCGSYCWFRVRAAARRDEQGEIIRWYGTLEDIHDRKVMDATLRESEAFARSVLESAPDCMGVLDLQGNVQFLNGPGLQILEIDDFGNFEGRQWADVWPQSSRINIENALQVARGGTTARFSGFCPTAKGTPKWWDVSVSPILTPEGKPGRMLVASRDMTSAKSVKDALEQAKQDAEASAQRLENVLSSTTDCVVTFDRQLCVVYLNRRAQEVVPRAGSLVGMPYHEAFRELLSTPFEEHFKTATEQCLPVHFEGYFAAYDRWLDVHLYPSPDGISFFFRDVTERQRAQEQLLYLAHHDVLTGLANRAILHEELDQSLSATFLNKQTALLFLDLDEFKSVNDSLGHWEGDRLLIQVGGRLKNCVRHSDLVARFGGDEFAVVAKVEGPDEAANLAERIIVSLEEPYDLDGRRVAVGVSIGIVMASETSLTAGDALRKADIALYRAKAEGRGTYRVFDPAMEQRFEEREAVRRDLRGAVARREFRIEYQPLFNVKTNSIAGFEALLRWHHPSRGLVSPVVFIPVAEETGLIVEIGEWVLEKACRDAATWPGGIVVAVNLSPVQFRTSNLLQTVMDGLSGSGLPGNRLQLEITESVLLSDSAANLEILHALRELGIAIAMDDFGTGYSSLSYLRSFPFDKIKVDQSFVSDLSVTDGNGESRAIVRTIISLAQSLGICTTAEGVENTAQLSALRAMECDEVQGYLISRAVAAEEVTQTILRLNKALI